MNTHRSINSDKKISEETALMIKALEMIVKGEETAYKAYLGEYGEDSLWRESETRRGFDDLKRTIKIAIGDFIEITMGEEEYQII